jgi:hypothetical protein
MVKATEEYIDRLAREAETYYWERKTVQNYLISVVGEGVTRIQ